MGIHYDYKSTRGEKALKKEAKKKARLEQRRAKKIKDNPLPKKEDKMQPVVVDINLKGNTASRQNSARLGYYMKQGYSVREL